MKRDVVQVTIRGMVSVQNGCAIFVGNDEKVFVIQVDSQMGFIIGRYLEGARNERPLTHDLLGSVLRGFDIAVERVVITELKESTYFARLLLRMKNELGEKIVEIDARPSDCLAIASAHKRPVYVAAKLFEEVDDMSQQLKKLDEGGGGEGEGEE
jgi:uncharacterized protein